MPPIAFTAFASPAPIVRLVNAFERPLDNAVATARTCYSPRIVEPHEVAATDKARALRDRLADETYAAGHHTTLQHATFQFTLERVSRQLVWSLLHAHPFYNSEQVSQRYVPVSSDSFAIPALPTAEDAIFRRAVRRAMAAYESLCEQLLPPAADAYFALFPARLQERDRHLATVRKKAMEAARYALPVAAFTHLYHSVSGLTLHRYARIARQCDTPVEARQVIGAMVEAVRAHDPEFFRRLDDSLPLEKTPEFALFEQLGISSAGLADPAFIQEFDASLDGHASRLIDWKVRGQETLADAIRSTLGLTRAALDDGAALDAVLSPCANPLIAMPLRLGTMDKLMRALSHPHYTFRKKLSHSADAQDQRHRMVPGSRPWLFRQYAVGRPDLVRPALIDRTPAARAFFDEEMAALFGAIDELLERGVPPEAALYLLPNAFPIRFEESGELLHLHHKWTTRLCLTAQEEIWRATRDEVEAVRAVHPRIARWIGPPCWLRNEADEAPRCPEGPRFCGVRAWRAAMGELDRVI
ncbi:MAG: FAD-dependent thymidylate synthase [Myxococcales bacterium]|jgi:thymidylate synthase ThyX|nr:FAD-dependent thymidylate synthase [Myxococcales bacterium]